jgi:hypothetical protein
MAYRVEVSDVAIVWLKRNGVQYFRASRCAMTTGGSGTPAWVPYEVLFRSFSMFSCLVNVRYRQMSDDIVDILRQEHNCSFRTKNNCPAIRKFCFIKKCKDEKLSDT